MSVAVVANGRTVEIPEGTTVEDLVTSLGLLPRRVVVERNGEPVLRAEYRDVTLQQDDRIEIVRAVPGG